MESWSPLEAFAGNQSVSFPQPLWAPKWRVRGGKPKEEQKEGWVLVGRGHPASNRRGQRSGSSLLAEMNGSERGLVLYFRAGGEGHKRRLPYRGVYSTHSPVSRTAQVSVRLRMRTSFSSAHSPFTRFSKQRRKGGQQVPRALCPTHLSRSKCSSPVPPNAPISRQRSCECAVMLRMLHHRIDRSSSRSFPVHSLYISDTQGRTRWEGSSPSLCPADHSAGISHSRPRPSLIGKSLPFPSNDPASPGSSTVRAPFPPYGMLPRRRPTTLRACGVFARRSLPVVPSSPLAVWAGCPSLLRSFKLWIKGTNVVEWNSRRVTRSTVPRCEVQVVMITPGYALAPLTGTPEPANARENPGRSVLHSSDRRGTKQGIASGIGADSASAASCRTGVIQYVVPRVPPLLRSFPILIVKHHEQQDVEVRNSK
ncbi:hypothetical protein KY284_006433 [Solanum tuberosum]|nr:hypothetical protein KY284_036863 [Solanum tuberosum]KAH0721403.1 hypothetical protein KY284_006433 [Solanum tuberosum]